MYETETFEHSIRTEEELRAVIGSPGELVKNKAITELDHHCLQFISQSPFVVLSTSNDQGYCDASPRGDQPGFVKVVNEKQLVIPERPGNRRADSLRNILSNPKIGILFVIPGLGETLRVNGRAKIIKDEKLLAEMFVRGKAPLLGIGVEVEEGYIHCAKAFKRSGLWEPDTWAEKEQLPSASQMLLEHAKPKGSTAETIENMLHTEYTKGLY